MNEDEVGSLENEESLFTCKRCGSIAAADLGEHLCDDCEDTMTGLSRNAEIYCA